MKLKLPESLETLGQPLSNNIPHNGIDRETFIRRIITSLTNFIRDERFVKKNPPKHRS